MQDLPAPRLRPANATAARDNPIPTPPFWGARTIERLPFDAVLPYLNRSALYKMQWGFKSGGRTPEAWRAWARSEVDPILNRLARENREREVLSPQAAYGYFPAGSEGEDLVILDARGGERCRFALPRQRTGQRLCIADWFRPLDAADAPDVVAFQIVTVGQRASDFARELFHADRYQEYLYWHGLNAEGAEAAAEFIHKRIRAELGFGREDARDIGALLKQKYRGARYSFGYPACPDLAAQGQLLELLHADKIGVRLGDEDQLWPEESTSAIVVHHPEARYFGV